MNTIFEEPAAFRRMETNWMPRRSDIFAAAAPGGVGGHRCPDRIIGNEFPCDHALPRLLCALTARVTTVSEVQTLCVWVCQPKLGLIKLHALVANPPSEIQAGITFSLDDSIAGWVWKHQRPLVIDSAAEARFSRILPGSCWAPASGHFAPRP